MEIKIHDPLASFLGGPAPVERFNITLQDCARLAGHLCPSVAGAFLISRAAVQELFSEGVCVRGTLAVDIAEAHDSGATGPMAHVFSFVMGAWDESGFGGLGGERFRRRNLLTYSSPKATPGWIRFHHLPSGRVIEVGYRPERAPFEPAPNADFASNWQARVSAILAAAEQVIEVRQSR